MLIKIDYTKWNKVNKYHKIYKYVYYLKAQRKPKYFTKVLQSLHGQFCGTHFLIFLLNWIRELQFLISSGICSQILGAKYRKLLIPKFVVLTFVDTIVLPLRRFKLVSFIWNKLCIKGEDRLCRALYNSTANNCKFLWWMLTVSD